MTRFDNADFNYRRHGPAVTAAGDGLVGIYSAILHTVPSGGSCKVLIPAFNLAHYYTANCPAIFSGAIGDSVLVAFDEGKDPWVVVPSALTPPVTGTVSFTFAASSTSAAQTVTHGVGHTPKVWLQLDSANDTIGSSVTARTSTTFTAHAFRTDGVAATGTVSYVWLAI